jgi:hypothetical protein
MFAARQYITIPPASLCVEYKEPARGRTHSWKIQRLPAKTQNIFWLEMVYKTTKFEVNSTTRTAALILAVYFK